MQLYVLGAHLTWCNFNFYGIALILCFPKWDVEFNSISMKTKANCTRMQLLIKFLAIVLSQSLWYM